MYKYIWNKSNASRATFIFYVYMLFVYILHSFQSIISQKEKQYLFIKHVSLLPQTETIHEGD